MIPVRLGARTGNYTLNMFLNDHSPIAAGRELRGFPKKLAGPTLRVETDTLVGTLDSGPVRVATGTMGFKHREGDAAATLGSCPPPISCSSSSRTWTAPHAFASWSNIISRTSG